MWIKQKIIKTQKMKNSQIIQIKIPKIVYFYIDFYTKKIMSLAFLLRSKSGPEDSQIHHVKQLTPQRWRQFMLEVLQKMQKNPKNQKKKNLITDLITIVSNISETCFIQSALQIRPFKPQFIEKNYIETDASQSTSSTIAETITKAVKIKVPTIYMKKKQMKTQGMLQRKQITQKTLQNQLNKTHHPYTYIIKNFSHLLQLKYKNVIEKKKLNINQIVKHLKRDMEVFYQFMRLSSAPYRKLFKLNINESEEVSANKMCRFIDNYIFQNPKINSSLHKIVAFSAKTQYSQIIDQKIVNFDEPDNYQIPKDFKIDGCYLQSMNSLIQFSQLSHNHQKAMKKLLQFRNCILNDINQYYMTNTGSTKQLQLNAEVQIEIIRFILGKLKNWACQIFTQLKFLELIYGDQQISYKYEYISFMYTQLTLAFQILGIN